MPLGSKEHFAPPSGTVEKNPPASAGGARDIALIPGSRRSPEGGSGNPLQYSYLGMDRGAWWTAVHGVSQSRTQLGTPTHRRARTGTLSGGTRSPPPSCQIWSLRSHHFRKSIIWVNGGVSFLLLSLHFTALVLLL